MRSSALVVALALAATMVVAPASTYSTGAVDRGSSLVVASDPNAVVGLDTPDTESQTSTGTLTVLTNRLDMSQEFTITVRSSNADKYTLSTSDPTGPRGTGSLTVALDPGEQVTVTYDSGGQPQGDVRFSVTTDGAVSATLTDRLRPIAEPGNGGGPCNDNGNGRGPPRCR